MALRVIEDSKLNNIAVAIQQKSGNYEPMTVDEMPGRVPDGSFDMSVEPNQIKMLVFLTDEDEEERSCAVSFVQTVPHGVEIDWGDGSKEISDEQLSPKISNITKYNHVYLKGGFYVITLTAISGEITFFSNNYSAGTLILNSGYKMNSNVEMCISGIYKRRLIEMAVGDDVILDDYALNNLPALRKINRITTTPISNTLSKGIKTAIGVIDIPEGVTSVSDYCFSSGVMAGYIKELVFPSTIKEIGAYAFNGQTGAFKYDFAKVQLNENGELPFSVQSTSFNGFNNFTPAKIIFATKEIAEVAKSTTNLSQFADYITYEGAE